MADEEFVVSGAMTMCDGSANPKTRVKYVANDTQIYIGKKQLATEADTSAKGITRLDIY